MNSECFLTRSFRRRSSRYSSWSSFRCSTILVPRPMGSELSLVTVNEPPACDSQRYCSSSLCLVYTTTFSATRYAE